MKKYKKKAVELKAIWSRKQKTSQLLGRTPINDAARPKPKGRHVADGRREKYATVNINSNKYATVNICSYNVRTLSTNDDLDNLMEELGKIEWDIVGICETYRKGEGLSIITNGHYIYEIGKTEEHPDAKGVALLINTKIKDYISNTKIYSDRVIKLNLNLIGQEHITIIMAYAPTSSATDEEIETFYENIEQAFKEQQIKI